MRSRKVFYYLSALSTPELDEFRQFLESPVFNRQSMPVKVFDLLRSALIEGDGDLSPRAFFAMLYPEKPAYNAKRLTDVLNQLQGLLEEFLAVQEFRRDGLNREIYFLRSLERKDLPRYFDAQSRRTEERIRKGPNDAFTFHRLFEVHASMRQVFNHQSRRSRDESLHALYVDLENHYLTWRLKIASTALNDARIIHLPMDDPDLQRLAQLPELEAERRDSLPLVTRLYLMVNEMMRAEPEQEESAYRAFRDRMMEAPGLLGQDEFLPLYLLLVNFCIRRINLGDRQYVDEIANLYDKALRDGYFLEEGRLASENLKNIISVLASIRRFDMAKSTLETYKNKLHSDPEEVAIDYNRALIHFFEGEYRDSLRLLNGVLDRVRDVFYELDSRLYHLMSWYHLHGPATVGAYIDSFNQFVGRHSRIPEDTLTSYQNFLRFFARFIRRSRDLELSLSKKKVEARLRRLQDLEKQVRVQESMVRKTWLLQQIGICIAKLQEKA